LVHYFHLFALDGNTLSFFDHHFQYGVKVPLTKPLVNLEPSGMAEDVPVIFKSFHLILCFK
jgi:hypothetical protein